MNRPPPGGYFSGRRLCCTAAGPEAVFGFAAGFEGGDFADSGMIPAQDLKGGAVIAAGIEVLKKC